MANLKMSDVLWVTAEATNEIAIKAGIRYLTITDIYTTENINELAVIAGLLKQLAAKVSKQEIEVIKQ